MLKLFFSSWLWSQIYERQHLHSLGHGIWITLVLVDLSSCEMAVPIQEPSVVSPGTPPMSLILDMNGTLPDFAESYDYACNFCKGKLLDPMQTKCGHRLCRRCLEKHLAKQDPAMCPFEEEDCEMISLKEKDGSVCLLKLIFFLIYYV